MGATTDQGARPKTTRVFVQNKVVSEIGGIRTAGIVKHGKGMLTRTRVLDRYNLAYVVEGRGRYRGRTTGEHTISTGDAIFVPPGEVHWYGPEPGTTWNQVYILFEGAVFDMWRSAGYLNWPAPVQSLKPIRYWADRITSTAGKNNDSNPVKMLDEPLRLQSLLAEMRDASRNNFEEEVVWLEAAKAALFEKSTAHEAAASLDITYETFRKHFRELTGMPPHKYRTAMIMEVACKLLADKNRSINSIAEELGFCDAFHFSKQFRGVVGWPPSEFRARILSE
jgi:AraC-like DNA-binding protein